MLIGFEQVNALQRGIMKISKKWNFWILFSFIWNDNFYRYAANSFGG